MKTKNIVLVIVILALLILSLTLGLSLGKKQGAEVDKAESETTEKLKSLVDLAFPKPPQEIKTFGGTIKGFNGNVVGLEIIDPEDYLPHTDGTEQRREIRFVSVSSNTKITLIDYTIPDAQGSPIVTSLELSDLKIGDTIIVRSDQNIRDAEKFDVTQIELVRY